MIGIWLQIIWDKICGRQYNHLMEKPDWSSVPKTLDEAVDRLMDDNQENEDLKHFLSKESDGSSFVAKLYFECGMKLRNEWGLWDHENPSDLAKWFNDRGIYHADDMSGIIFRTFYFRSKGQDERLSEQIEAIRQYWRNQGLDPDKLFNGE